MARLGVLCSRSKRGRWELSRGGEIRGPVLVLQNEETLKKCVEDYLERIKKEEQRYQALKAHAEEKLDQ